MENTPEVASEDFLIISLLNNCNDYSRKSINFLKNHLLFIFGENFLPVEMSCRFLASI